MASGKITVLTTSPTIRVDFQYQTTPGNAYDNSSKITCMACYYLNQPLSDLYAYSIVAYFNVFYYDSNGAKVSLSSGTSFNGGALQNTSIPASPAYVAAVFTATVPHNWDGSQAIYVENSGGTIQIKSGSTVKNFSINALSATKINLEKINRFAWLTSAPDFSDLDNPTIYFTNPSGASNAGLKAGIYDINGVEAFAAYRNVDPYSTYYTFYLTDAEREKLKTYANNNNGSLPVRFYLTTWQPGGANYSSLARTMTVAGDPPTLDITLYDTDEGAQAAVGNNTKIIKGHNYVYYEINATPDEGATITSYTAKCGDKTLTTQSGYFENVESGDFTFTATDNRGRTKTESKSLSVIDYFKPTINQEIELELVGETGARANMKITGTFWNGNFGLKKNNLKISFKKTDDNGEWLDWQDIQEPPYFIEIYNDGNTFWSEFALTGLDYSKPYTFQCAVADTLGSYATTPEYTAKLIPVFDWSETDFNFNVPVKITGDLNITGTLNVGGEDSGSGDAVIETGTEAMGSNGTWYWSKWRSGKVECYGVRNYGNMGVSTAWGGVYYSNDVFSQDLPSGLFSEPPYVIDINIQGTTTGSAWIAKNSMPTATNTGGFIVVRGAAGTLSQVYIGFHIVGRWK